MFTANENSRRPPGGGRMQNGKLDLGAPRQDASWYPATANAASRTGAQSFAQTIGGGAGQSRPFDPSEFPTLGGGGSAVSGPATAWSQQGRSPGPARRAPYGRGMGQALDEAPSNDARPPPPGADNYRFGGGRTNQTADRSSARSPFAQEQEPIGYTGRQEPPAPALNSDGPSSPQAAPQQSSDPAVPVNRVSDMTDREKFGIKGLVARVTPGHPDYDPLTTGFDLTKLGINMDSNEPLINTWAGPFDDNNYVIPDFTLPQAYTVNNVPPLATKLESFSDETLIMIFYQHPRDILQELAAQTLYKREWRWHKIMRCWMMKDSTNQHINGFGQGPVRLSDKTERGMYILFDVNSWRRERKELILNFDDLDTRPSLMQGTGLAGASATTGTPGAATNGLGGGLGAASGFVGGAGAFGVGGGA